MKNIIESKRLKLFIFTVFLMIAAFLASCESSQKSSQKGATEKGEPSVSNQTNSNKANSSQANSQTASGQIRLIAWKNQNTGGPSKPLWLNALVRGDSSEFKNAFSGIVKDGDIVRYSLAEHTNREIAELDAELNFASMIARELRISVLEQAGKSLQSGDYEKVKNSAIETKATYIDVRELERFWQQIEIKSKETGAKTTLYCVYIVYAIPANIWNTMYSKYTSDVFGALPESPGKKEIRGMAAQMRSSVTEDKKKTEEQFKMELEAQQEALKNQYQIDLAKINMETAKQFSQQRSEQAQLTANSQAEQAAFKSGTPAESAAASATPVDAALLKALATAAKILF